MFNNFKVNDELISFDHVQKTANTVYFTNEKEKVSVQLIKQLGAKLWLLVQIGENSPTQIVVDVQQKAKNQLFRMALSGHEVEVKALSNAKDDANNSAGYEAPMTAKIVEVLVKAGDAVTAGQRLIVLEAMKLQIDIKAQEDSIVEKVMVEAGSQVQQGDVLVKMAIEAENDEIA